MYLWGYGSLGQAWSLIKKLARLIGLPVWPDEPSLRKDQKTDADAVVHPSFQPDKMGYVIQQVWSGQSGGKDIDGQCDREKYPQCRVDNMIDGVFWMHTEYNWQFV